MSLGKGEPPGAVAMSACPVCGSVPDSYLMPWLRRCGGCGLRSASLEGDVAHGWDDAAEIAMAPLRRDAARRLLAELARVTVPGSKRLLDVGCGPGWFLKAALEAGFAVSGIEPDARLAARGREAGLDVITGRFPVAAGNTPRDIITFNDVFEHLPSPLEALAAVRAQLVTRGLLMLNLPSHAGPVYRASEILARTGITRPLERMWQKDFESPHLFYYAPTDLDRLIEGRGFERIRTFTLPSISVRRLWTRIRADANRKLAGDVLTYVAALSAVPILKLLPSDIMVRIYRRL